MIPIAFKIKLKLTDDIDVGYYDVEVMRAKPVVDHFVQRIGKRFAERYGYRFSLRERYLLFNLVLGILNRIALSHAKLKLAVIATDGRLSTQQLKFNLQHYFSAYIERVDAKVLYELELMDDLDYDYYLCMDYGKHMKIDYRPIYFADEKLTESKYIASLEQIFYAAYGYDRALPKPEYVEIDARYKFKVFPVENYLAEGPGCAQIALGSKAEAKLCLNFSAKRESVRIFSFAKPDDYTLYGEKYFIVIELRIDGNKQKLKMILNVVDSITDDIQILNAGRKNPDTSYRRFIVAR